MSLLKLKDRISSYEENSNYKLIQKVPIVITINGRSFSKITSALDKPYCKKFAECMDFTVMRLVSEVEGAVFVYYFNDEINIIIRNDQHAETMPWFDNKIQKISSITSSIATLQFNNFANAVELDIPADGAFFTSNTFAIPNIAEAANTIIYKQQQCFQSSVHQACYYNLLTKYDKNDVKEMIFGISVDEKIELLQQECNIDYNKYPIEFKRGSACYRVPKIYDEGNIKYKWSINKELPIFTQDHSFLVSILKNGSDVVRDGFTSF